MYLSDVTFAMKNLLFAAFRDPSLLWQLTPILLLWFTLSIYFATHKTEELGWNTSLAHGLSLFWVVASAMQHLFSQDGLYFTWTKFIVFILITLYSLFITYISFKHTLPPKWTYVFASHHIIYYLSFISLLYAYDMIYVDLPMMISIILFFSFIVGLFYLLKRTLPALKEEIDDSPLADTESLSFDESPEIAPESSSSLKGI